MPLPATPLPQPARAAASPVEGDGLALLSAALAAACFVGMDSVIKLLALRYETLQLGFFRFAAGALFALPLWLARGAPMPAAGSWRLHAWRSVLLLISLLGYFYALTTLPLALAVTISYLSPIFVAALSIPLLGERPSPAVWVALAAGLVGVSISVWPEWRGGVEGLALPRLAGMASAAVAALSFAGVLLLARRQAQHDSLWTILLVQSLLPMLLLAGPAAATWRPVPLADSGLILLVGALGTLGLVGITLAFTRLEASRVAPLDYTGFVWAALLGYLLFGEVPTPTTLGSALLIVGGCLLLLRR
ncbi:MAG TPA: DMT family transporter [Burkholderiaceae bacterium]|nr:DMT family transporter [Burkholderiaceae bacterium]